MNAREKRREGALRPQGIISGTPERVQDHDSLAGDSSVLAIQRRPPHLSEGGAWSKGWLLCAPGAASGLSEGWGEAGRAGLLGDLGERPGVPES